MGFVSVLDSGMVGGLTRYISKSEAVSIDVIKYSLRLCLAGRAAELVLLNEITDGGGR